MATIFNPGQTLGRGDLDIFLVDGSDDPTNAYSITYAIFSVNGSETLIGAAARTPVNPTVGEYYASLMVPPAATDGAYRIRWTFQETSSGSVQTVAQDWTVASTDGASAVIFSNSEGAMIGKLRTLLRDNNPDRNYHFRPPEHEGNIGAYNQVFGFVWEDGELLEYLEIALDEWNMFPPETESLCNLDKLVSMKPVWRTAVLWGAIRHAAMALAFNWVVDEFDYSIGGVSLSIEKSSKYESLKSNAEQQFEKAAEAKQRTTKFIRGLKQSRYGVGARSAFGPHVGSGVLSPRNFLVLPWLMIGYGAWEVFTHACHMSTLLA